SREDRSRRDLDVMAASRAGVRATTALCGRVLLEGHAFALALRAIGRLSIGREAVPPEPIEAGVIVRKLAHKLHEREAGIGRIGALRVLSVYRGHALHPITIYTRKGYLPYLSIEPLSSIHGYRFSLTSSQDQRSPLMAELTDIATVREEVRERYAAAARAGDC